MPLAGVDGSNVGQPGIARFMSQWVKLQLVLLIHFGGEGPITSDTWVGCYVEWTA
jgi:hypothetical protein